MLGNRSVTVCREITKKHETCWKTTLQEASDFCAEGEPKGECILVIEGLSREAIEKEAQQKWVAGRPLHIHHALNLSDLFHNFCEKLLDTVNTRMERAGVELQVPDAALDALSATGYDPVYGARPLRRAIQSTIADQAAGMLLDGTLQHGDVVTAEVHDGKIVLTKTCERGTITS